MCVYRLNSFSFCGVPTHVMSGRAGSSYFFIILLSTLLISPRALRILNSYLVYYISECRYLSTNGFYLKRCRRAGSNYELKLHIQRTIILNPVYVVDVGQMQFDQCFVDEFAVFWRMSVNLVRACYSGAGVLLAANTFAIHQQQHWVVYAYWFEVVSLKNEQQMYTVLSSFSCSL